MGITTLVKNYFVYFILALSLFGFNNAAYSQCPTVANGSQSFCDTQSPTIADLQATDNGGGVRWYASAVSVTPLSSGAALQNGEDYFADDNTGACGARQSTIVTIYSAPVADPFQGPCVENLSDATLEDFVAIGNNIQWYANSTGGSPLPITTVIVNGTLYYASQMNPNGLCESSRRPVRAVVGYVPTPTGPPVQNFCNVAGTPPTVADLVASGNNNWYLNSFSSVPLSLSTQLINGHSYFATTVDPPCESSNRLEVVVNIYEPNDAGTNGQRRICSDQIATTSPFDLFNELGGSPDNTGVWTGPIATTNGFQGTLNVSTMTLAGSPYVFTYTVSNPACANTVSTVTITISPQPTVTVTSPTVCSNTPATVTATPTPAGTYSYVWTVPAGATNPGNVATFTTTTAGTYSVIATSTTTTCPSATASTTVVINPIPTVTVTSPPVCSGTPATVTATPTPAGTYSYVWTVPAGATNPGNVATFTTTTAGTYSVIATDTTTTCPSASASTTVVINPIPTVTVTSPPVCSGTPATVTATPTPAGTYSYVWTVPTGATNPGNVATFTTTTAGTYSVIATNTTTNCPSATASTTVVINPIPTVTVTSPPVCSGTPATVMATPTPAGTYSYVWTVPAGATNPGNVATFTTTTAGTYSVIATNTTTTCPSASASATVVINPIPTVTVTSPPVCSGTPATVTATPTPAGTYSYVWTVPAGATNPGNVATFTTTTAGTYSVIATSTTTTCPSATASTTVVINPIPTVTVTSPPVCSGTPATVTATPTPAGTYSYVWTVPAGATNPGNVATFTTTTAGTYSVIATDTTAICPSASSSTTVVINPIPNAGNDTALPLCSNQNSVDLFPLLGVTAQPGGVWTDPSNAVVTNILDPATAASGNYTYTVMGIAPCVDDTATIAVTITPGPEAGISGPFSICTNSATHDLFLELGPNAQPGGTWSPALDSGTGFFNPLVDAAGDYTYTLTGTNPCDNDEATITVSILPVPDAGTGATPTICTNDSPVDLFSYLGGTPQTGGVWTDSSNTVVSNMFDPAVGLSGDYTYTIVGGVGCPPATAVVSITVLQSPNAGGGGPIAACIDNTGLDLINALDGTQGAGTFSDDDSTGALSGTIFNPSLVPAGVYHFTYTVGGGAAPCLFDTALVTVTVSALPNAGTFVAGSPICNAVGTFDLTTLLQNQDANGLWYDINGDEITNPVNVSTLPAGIYQYDYVVSNDCGSSNPTTVSFEILPNPEILSANISIAPVCINNDVTVSLTGMVDGTYALNYDLSGSNTLANQTATVTVAGGTASFVIPTANVPAVGTTTITFTNIQNTVTSCQSVVTNTSGTIVINPIVQIDNATITVANVCLGSAATVTLTNAVNLPDGDYQFDYTIPTGTPTTGNSGNVTISGGSGSFTIPASVFATVGSYSITINTIITTTGCSNNSEDATANFSVVTPLSAGNFSGTIPTYCSSVGVINLATLLTGQDAGGVWTDSSSQVVLSQINILTFTAGTYSYTYTVSNACGTDFEIVQFTVLATPTLSSLNLNVPSICIGANGNVNFSGMADGTYTLNYDLGGSNPLAGQQAIVTIFGGSGSFSIPSTVLPNVGTTIISFTNIINNTNSCFSLVNVTASLVVKPFADMDSTNLSIANVCIGDAVVVNITNAVNLPDDTYQFNYSIPGATPVTGNSGNVIVTGGVGQFTVPATVFTTAGNYTLTIFGIIATTGCTNATEDASTNFTINGTPDVTGATLTGQDTCLNFDSIATISGATNLADGSYTIQYDLSGANTATAVSTTVNFVSGLASVVIPGTGLTNAGATTITITQVDSATSTCSGPIAIVLSALFDVSTLAEPTLVTDGNIFCDDDHPTVANLTANIVGGQTVIWYNAPTGGNVYDETELLVDGTIYYAASVAQSGCESASRLPVTADLSGCEELTFPDGFSPNDDTVNNTFIIKNLAELYPNFKLEIYNRYGNLVYQGNINTPNWDGTSTQGGLKLGNNVLPTGVYFYIVYFNDGVRKPYQDRVYLSR